MPEPTIDELAARVAELEHQVATLKVLPPPRRPPQPIGAPSGTGDGLAARVSSLEQQVAGLWAAWRVPKSLPPLKPTSTYENLVGTGADLWDSDEELDQFLADLRKRRHAEG